ncbi:MAG: HAD-IIIA family hydrolase [Nitrospiraceae bacterium]
MDLDGTLILGPDQRGGKFITSLEDVELFDGVLDKLRWFKGHGWRLVLMSNQGGIATGHTTEHQIVRLMSEVNRMTANLLDQICYCPHHPTALGSSPEETMELRSCWCRKPSPGMIYNSLGALSISYPSEIYRPYTSLMVGDLSTDKQCAEAANLPFVWAEEWRQYPSDELIGLHVPSKKDVIITHGPLSE